MGGWGGGGGGFEEKPVTNTFVPALFTNTFVLVLLFHDNMFLITRIRTKGTAGVLG